MFPVLVMVTRKTGPLALILVTSALSILSAGYLASDARWISRQFTPVLFYLPLFALGMIGARLYRRFLAGPPHVLFFRSTRSVRLMLIAALAVAIGYVPPDPDGWLSYYRIIPFGLFYFFLLLFALCDPVGQRVFSFRPLVGLGIISYSLYLVHEPIIHYAYFVCRQYDWSPLQQALFFQCVLAPFCVCIGMVFFFCIERRFLHQSKRVRKAAVADSAIQASAP